MEKIEKVFEQIGKEIAEMKEATIEREVAKKIGELLRDNGVVVNITECTCDDVTETSFSRKYGASITGLDFTEHDKLFSDKIVELLKKNDNLVKMINELQLEKANIDCELHNAKQRIEELESKVTEKKTEINLNDIVKVKLTPLGVEIYYHQYDDLNKKIKENCGTPLEPRMPQIDKDGYTEFTLWGFMEIYGEHIGMCKPNVILPLNIIISE